MKHVKDQKCIVKKNKTNLKQAKVIRKQKEQRLGIHEHFFKTRVGSGALEGRVFTKRGTLHHHENKVHSFNFLYILFRHLL